MEESSPVMSCTETHCNLSQGDGRVRKVGVKVKPKVRVKVMANAKAKTQQAGPAGGKSVEPEVGPDGLRPGWVWGALMWTADENGVWRSFGNSGHAIPMVCGVCGALCDHWPKDCPSDIPPKSLINFKDPNVFLRRTK